MEVLEMASLDFADAMLLGRGRMFDAGADLAVTSVVVLFPLG
jgi:hypothetical protein